MNLSVCPIYELVPCVSSSDTVFMCNNNLEAIIALIKTSNLIKNGLGSSEISVLSLLSSELTVVAQLEVCFGGSD